jgi:hypothetical protein
LTLSGNQNRHSEKLLANLTTQVDHHFATVRTHKVNLVQKWNNEQSLVCVAGGAIVMQKSIKVGEWKGR